MNPGLPLVGSGEQFGATDAASVWRRLLGSRTRQEGMQQVEVSASYNGVRIQLALTTDLSASELQAVGRCVPDSVAAAVAAPGHSRRVARIVRRLGDWLTARLLRGKRALGAM